MPEQISLGLPRRLDLKVGGVYLHPHHGTLSRLLRLEPGAAFFCKLTGADRGARWSAAIRWLEADGEMEPFGGDLDRLRLVLVGCSKQKRLERAPRARDLYDPSALYRAARGYAEASGNPWAILSARYGLLEAWQIARPYDEALADKSPAERAAWGAAVADKLQQGWPGLATVEIHAGAPYVEAVAAALVGSGVAVEAPLAGLEIGMRKRWYAQHQARSAAV